MQEMKDKHKHSEWNRIQIFVFIIPQGFIKI